MSDTLKGCGRTTGHGDRCADGWLCSQCERIAALEAENARMKGGIQSRAAEVEHLRTRLAALEARDRAAEAQISVAMADWRKIKARLAAAEKNLTACLDSMSICSGSCGNGPTRQLLDEHMAEGGAS